MLMPRLDTLTLFASRESPAVLRETVFAACRAAKGQALVRVLVNGNPALAAALRTGPAPDAPIEIVTLPVADKAHAWNHCLHALWGGEERMFFADGYVRLRPDAIAVLAAALVARPDALAGSGVPGNGRSAARQREAMARQGGMHGNFCALTAPAITVIRARGLRLPLGLYRTEALWRACCCYNFDPAHHAWRDERVVVADAARWDVPLPAWWRPADWRAAWRRRRRQARGALENRATREHLSLQRLPPDDLPLRVEALLATWQARRSGHGAGAPSPGVDPAQGQ